MEIKLSDNNHLTLRWVNTDTLSFTPRLIMQLFHVA
jgi:hypothetical protein